MPFCHVDTGLVPCLTCRRFHGVADEAGRGGSIGGGTAEHGFAGWRVAHNWGDMAVFLRLCAADMRVISTHESQIVGKWPFLYCVKRTECDNKYPLSATTSEIWPYLAVVYKRG